MHRRPLGNGRRLAFAGAIVLLVGCLLPWYAVGGDGGLPTVMRHAWDGSGIASLLAALSTIALVALPYAAGERPMAVDRGLAFLLLALVALAGVILWVPGLLDAPEGLLPASAYGYWIAVVGTLMMLRAAYDVMLEPPRG
jgi:hypothetical protein